MVTTDITTTATAVPAAASLTTVPPTSVSYLDIRRDTVTYPRIQTVPREVAVAALGQIIFRALFNAAASSFRDEDQADRIALMASELYDVIIEDYDALGTSLLSFAEIARVIRAASVSKDLYGVSVRTLYVALTEYCLGDGQQASRALRAEIWADKRQSYPPREDTAPTDADRRTLAAALDNLARSKNLNGKK